MQYWLMKSEPGEFSIDDLKRVRVEPWDGIRNYQARNFIRDQMSRGDRAFFYHSSCKTPAIVGTMKIAGAAYPDPTAFDPKNAHYDPKSDPDNPTWMLVDVRFVRKFKHPLTLEQLKCERRLAGMRLLKRGNRLSVFPVDKAHWEHIHKMLEK
ncbi:MAG: EVE domain-containing protein [Gammaproteobacteria bacterium]|nr:EVE domain-containing protein [Gammaproteobacteria bacterium]CAJ2376969.1 MAG: EVE domain-containing protein [Arenicellales bacterium IbO2]MDA7962181.1 EVE domain-containing protein [Gammaproteobacteria bacterium]MDA7970613.1 EVE domain-containing protein [Gammaproteobacteria bacterium]MDA7972339.1 EVE domain-containing protein [Gammaproteobacteria bacterium]